MKTRSFRSHKDERTRLSEAVEGTRMRAEISARALIGNYRAIQALVPGLSMLPMIKADAYGHGAAWAAKTLAREPGLYGLGTATLEEGAEVRAELGPRGRKIPVLVFSGALLWTEEKGRYCEYHGLTPVLSSEADWQAFHRQGFTARLPYELKFNTGMNRLGMAPGFAAEIARKLRGIDGSQHPQGILSHLASGEDPDSRLSQSQRQKFAAIRTELAGVLPSAHFHLGNSAAIWHQKRWGLEDLTDVVRPGLSLYGVVPWPGAPARGLVPVMSLQARVAQIRELKPGETIGYGGTYQVSAGENRRVAIVTGGYADGLHRMMSNQGSAWLGGQLCRVLGIVSMDLVTVECPPGVGIGDWVEFLGAGLDPWAQARASGTVPYELLTSVSRRVLRVYPDGA